MPSPTGQKPRLVILDSQGILYGAWWQASIEGKDAIAAFGGWDRKW